MKEKFQNAIPEVFPKYIAGRIQHGFSKGFSTRLSKDNFEMNSVGDVHKFDKKSIFKTQSQISNAFSKVFYKRILQVPSKWLSLSFMAEFHATFPNDFSKRSSGKKKLKMVLQMRSK